MVWLHDWFSGSDARALQSGMQRFGETWMSPHSLVLVHWLIGIGHTAFWSDIYGVYFCFFCFGTVQYSTVQYSTVQYSTIQLTSVQAPSFPFLLPAGQEQVPSLHLARIAKHCLYRTVQYSTLYSTVHYTVQNCTVQYTIQYRTVQYSTLYSTEQYCI